MNNTLFEDTEAETEEMRDCRHRMALISAYANLLVEEKTVGSTTPELVGTEKARQNATKLARKDIARLFRAMDTVGIETTDCKRESAGA